MFFEASLLVLEERRSLWLPGVSAENVFMEGEEVSIYGHLCHPSVASAEELFDGCV